MSYVKGNVIAAADVGSFITSVSNVYGMGTGNRGYGQTAAALTAPTVGSTITAATWSALRTAIVTCATHQATSLTGFVPSGPLVTGQTIFAHEASPPSNNTYDLDSFIAAIDTNRLTPGAGQMTLTSAAFTMSTLATWTNSNTATMDITFTSEDTARYFFNSGGQIRLRFTHSVSSPTLADTAWSNIFSTKLGTVTIGATTITNSGTTNTCSSAPAGFYGIPTSATTIVNGTNIGTGSYASDSLSITAQVLNRANIRGGNGTTIRLVLTLTDTTGTTVKAGTQWIMDHYRATTTLVGIEIPGCVRQSGTNWGSASGGSTSWPNATSNNTNGIIYTTDLGAGGSDAYQGHDGNFSDVVGSIGSTAGAFWKVQFDTQRQITAISFTRYNTSTSVFSFQGSNDNSTWTTLCTNVSATGSYTVASPGLYLYYRLLLVTPDGGGDGAKFTEITATMA